MKSKINILLSTILEFHKKARTSDFIKKVSETFATKIFLVIVGLITSVIVARILGPEGRGSYAIALTISAIGIQFGNLGLHASNTFQAAKNKEFLPTLIGNSLFVSFILGGVCIILVWILFSIFPSISPLSSSSLLIISLVSIPLGLSYLLFQNLLLGIDKIRFYNITETLNKVLTVVFIGLLILIHFISPESIFFITISVQSFILLWMLYVLIDSANKNPNCSYDLFKECIGYGIKVYIACFLAFLVIRSDMLLVNYMLGAKQVGYYSIAVAITDMLYMLPTVTGSLLFPKLAAIEDMNYKWNYTKKVIWGVGLIMFFVIITTILLANPIVNLLYGKEFLPAVPAFIWLTPGIFMLSINSLLSSYIASKDIPIEIVYVYLIGFIVNLLINLILIPLLGIVGASISSSITYAICFIGIVLIVNNLNKNLC